MSRKDKAEISETSKKIETGQQLVFKYIVSEGSIVVLDARDLVKDIDTNSIKYYSWEQIAGIPIANDVVKDMPSLSFPAPYVQGSEFNTELTFELTVQDNDSKKRGPYPTNVIVKRIQRVMIFQAGVALGAYEAGVYQAIVEELINQDHRRGLAQRPLFDIVAGASIGAFNAAIVLSNAVKSRSWESSAQELVKFWRYQKYPFPTLAEFLDVILPYHMWWDVIHTINEVAKSSASTMIDSISNLNPYLKDFYKMLMGFYSLDQDFVKDYFIDGWYIPATGEAARRYYSSWQCKHGGVPNVASGVWPLPWSAFGKFFDFSDQSNFAFPRNFLPRADNKHLLAFSLIETLKKFAKFPIQTVKPDPRFLLVTVDVQTGDAVTFDSYEKHRHKNILGTRYYSEYGDGQNKKIIHYDRGIEVEHVAASGTFPDFFDYQKLIVKDEANQIQKHNFWDGSLRSTTPLREVIQAHRDYWHSPNSDEDDVPDLEVYIADLWPSVLKEEPSSFDFDFVENRKWNILLSDKTDYDEQVAKVVTDYNDLVNELKNVAERRGVPTDEINDILEKHAHSEKRDGQTRKYKDLIGGRFRLTKVVRIDRKDDGNEVNDKIFDYSSTTIENLMRLGYNDALTKMGIQLIKDKLMTIKSKTNLQEDKTLKELEQQLHLLEKDTKDGKSNDSKILNQIDALANKAKSMHYDANHNGSLNEEKTRLVDAAERFKEIIIEVNINSLAL